jgi:5,10-methylene-tetrahydrofolate dehydrogenase/methenyl tetrahydrofolate cyclohydrolase
VEPRVLNTRVIDGTALSRRLRGELAARVERLAARGIRPGLAAIEVGDHAASGVYVRNKIKACAESACIRRTSRCRPDDRGPCSAASRG